MPDCTEIQASWFQWAMRDAVQEAGHYRSLPEAARFYEQLAQEINSACDRHAIPCLPPRTGLLPPFRWQYIGDAVHSAGQLSRLLLHLGGDDIGRLPSEGPGVTVDLVAETAGPVARSMAAWSIIEAWIGVPNGVPSIILRAPAGTAIRSELLMTTGRAAPTRPGLSVLQMRLITDCPAQACDLVIAAGDQTMTLGKIAELTARPPFDRPELFVDVSRVTTHIAYQGQERRNALIERIARGIGRIYAVLTPILVVLGAIGLVSALIVERLEACSARLVILAVASAIAVACRIALLAYMDATSILSRDLLYVSPASPFVLLFAVVGTLMLGELGIKAIRRVR